MVRALGRWAGRVGLAVVVLALMGPAVGPYTGRYQPLTVLSGSMYPTFDAGDVVVAMPEPLAELRVGQIIIYTAPIAGGVVVSHRVVQLERDATGVVVHTRGDANNADDPWSARLTGPTVWQVRYYIPRLGSVLARLQHGPLRPVVLYACPILLAVLLLIRIWRPAAGPPGAVEPASAREEPGPDEEPDPSLVSLDELLAAPVN